jgi:hypothetical protein
MRALHRASMPDDGRCERMRAAVLPGAVALFLGGGLGGEHCPGVGVAGRGGVRLWQRARSVVLAAFAAQRDKRFFETPECPEKARFLDMMRHDHVFGFRVSR